MLKWENTYLLSKSEAAPSRHGRVRHGDRAAVAGLHLGREIKAGGAHDIGAGIGAAAGDQQMLERARMQALGHAGRHQIVVGWVELDEIEPPALCVEGLEAGRYFVGEARQLDGLGRAAPNTESFEIGGCIRATFPRDGLAQGGIGREEVHAHKGRTLVCDLVRVEGRWHGFGVRS